jgi:hypothetical protein
VSTNKITEAILKDSVEVERIGNRAVQKAQEENRRLGLPNVYRTRDGQPYYELPDGTITHESPFDKTVEAKNEKKEDNK